MNVWQELLEAESATLERWGVEDRAREKLAKFLERLAHNSQELNLIRWASPGELVRRHAMDSLRMLELDPMPGEGRGVDVGTGGGFPGIPLALARPGWHWVLVESLEKKAKVLRRLSAELGWTHVDVVTERAEVLGQDNAFRETFDRGFCRAVGPLGTVAELVLPLIKVGGHFWAHRGMEGSQEAAQAPEFLELLGGRVASVLDYQDEEAERQRFLVNIAKVTATPARFPRRVGVPAKRPLGGGRSWASDA